ncbi:hypothetical protein DYY65_04315 [Nitrososphaera sp. AFS]|nr:hypothetical protein [Nitrososphaera sp. AFS]
MEQGINLIKAYPIISAINNYLFKERQFRPNIQDYYNPTNSYLNFALKQ